jgi:hypothetical protein
LLIGFGCSRYMYHIYIYVYDMHLAPKETVDVKIEGFQGGSQPKVSFHLPGLLWSNHLPLDLPQVKTPCEWRNIHWHLVMPGISNMEKKIQLWIPWVNYNISLTWIKAPFGDDFPY